MTGGAEAPSTRRDLVKHAGEIMNILEAYDLVGTYRGAAELAGCDKNTVKHYVERRDAGLGPETGLVRASIIDPYRAKIYELVKRSHGRIRADVVHDKLVAMGFDGDGRTTRRAVADAKRRLQADQQRVYRPWIPEPGGWLQFDWGWGPRIGGRQTLLFCAWLAWSRFRIVIPTWDRTLATTIGCIDQTLRRLGGAPTYLLTDNEKTVTTEHIAGVPVRHPEIASAGRHYGVQITTCVPGDPESKGGSEATVKIAKADLVPTSANLRDEYASFAELVAQAALFCDKVNGRPHRETARIPSDMLVEEHARLHPIPAEPYAAALGEPRVVTRASVISLGGVRYSVPHTLIDQQVFVRVEGEEVVIAHQGRDGVAEVARHQVSTPGTPRIELSHYPPRSSSKILDHTPKPRTPEEAAFLAMGPGAAGWLTAAGAAGATRIRKKMDRALDFAAVYGSEAVDAALAAAAQASRFAEHDLASILRHQQQALDPGRIVVPIAEEMSLQPGTSRWKEVGR
jgi:transposase